MENDIPLRTWNHDEETTVLLRNVNRNRAKNRKPLIAGFSDKSLVVFFILSVILIATFAMFVNTSLLNLSYIYSQPEQALSTVKSKSLYTFQNGEYYVECAPIVSCDSKAKYRTNNGTCNNLNNPTWGSSYTPFIRLVNANYSDGISKFRLSSDGLSLPSSRKIQVKLFLNKQTNVGDKNNQLLMQWAQFIAHDVSNLATDKNGEDCCMNKNKSWVSRACEATIKIPDDDPVYMDYNKTCMQFNRAMTSANYSCPLKQSTFIDEASQYIDGSQIYGSNDYIVSSLRSFTDGMLKSVIDENQEFCPHTYVETFNTNEFFYNSGDSRANLNLGIALFHNMFLRFHNFVAFKLKTANSEWSDETLYQESRKFVGAIIQHITYTQFLPIILGKNYTKNEVLSDKYKYDSTVNPSTSLEFSVGAFRVLHNLIPSQYRFMDSNNTIVKLVNVTDWMNRPYILQQGSNFDYLLRGLINTEGRLSQPSYNFLISNYMFHPNNSIGLDLLSYDIQRGRDTGLPPYNKMRELCGLPVAKSFDDLVDVISSDDIYELENLYSSVDDIDFIVGALLEVPEEDALVGNTSRCIIGDFFYRSRVGDRFFYNNEDHPGHFTKDQIKVLKSINLDYIICASSTVNYLQKNIFTKVDNKWHSSIKWNCNEKYQINFKPWEEENSY